MAEHHSLSAVASLAYCRKATAVDSAMWLQLMLQCEAAMRAAGANQEAGFSGEPHPYGDGNGGRPHCLTHALALKVIERMLTPTQRLLGHMWSPFCGVSNSF